MFSKWNTDKNGAMISMDEKITHYLKNEVWKPRNSEVAHVFWRKYPLLCTHTFPVTAYLVLCTFFHWGI